MAPRCYIGKRYLEDAISKAPAGLDIKVRWRPFLLNPDASATGVNKKQMYYEKFGEDRVNQMVPMMTQVVTACLCLCSQFVLALSHLLNLGPDLTFLHPSPERQKKSFVFF